MAKGARRFQQPALHSVSGCGAFVCRGAVRTGADCAQVVEAVDARVVAVAEVEPEGVISDRFRPNRTGFFFVEREIADYFWLSAVSTAAGRAGTMVAEVIERIVAVVSVLPLNANAFSRLEKNAHTGGFGPGVNESGS